jgi:predicted RNase H-like HicB family nuclease
MQYLVVVEKTETSFGAYVPDLPGCVAVAASRDEVLGLIREAIESHLEDMVQSGQPIPRPTTTGEIVEIETA